jgi:hypothetical protein
VTREIARLTAHVLKNIVREDEMKEAGWKVGLAVRRNGPDHAVVIIPAPTDQILAPLGSRLANLCAERIVARRAQPGNVLAAPAAPVQHVHVGFFQAKPLPRQLQIPHDLAIGREFGKLGFGQNRVITHA